MISSHIDSKFKDCSPTETVANIRHILSELGICIDEIANNSGLDNCHSYQLLAQNASAMRSNGKGISDEFAKASAYGEFIERLQCGLFFYKYQSIYTDPAMNLQTYAPDAKYMTAAELQKNGEWMDWLIAEYGSGLTREKLVQQCRMYACTNEDRILTIPFYSLFEDKYVYLPFGFIEQIYSANGCCAGNTNEEALVHAFSEIMERKNKISIFLSGKAAPIIPRNILDQFPAVSKILKQLENENIYDITVFDFSCGSKFPVVATRIIDKKNHTYLTNAAADPVFEIALQRTLTEIFQGRNINNLRIAHNGQILKSVSDFPSAHNVLNLLENGNGLYAADFFADEDTVSEGFDFNNDLSNKELLKKMITMYRSFGKPVYIRNNSFLGFPCFKVIVPGFSESRGLNLTATIQDYALGDQAAKVLRNPSNASDIELTMLLMFYRKIQTAYSRANSFSRLAGLPSSGGKTDSQLPLTLAYASYRLKRWKDALSFTDRLLQKMKLSEDDFAYFSCVRHHLELLSKGIDSKKIRTILNKFHFEQNVAKLYILLDGEKTPYDSYLLACTPGNCKGCLLEDECSYIACQDIIHKAGERYSAFSEPKDLYKNLLSG